MQAIKIEEATGLLATRFAPERYQEFRTYEPCPSSLMTARRQSQVGISAEGVDYRGRAVQDSIVLGAERRLSVQAGPRRSAVRRSVPREA